MQRFRQVCSVGGRRDTGKSSAVLDDAGCFVDSKGKILCTPTVGRNAEQYFETLQELLSEME
jgi:hypothetical protein